MTQYRVAISTDNKMSWSGNGLRFNSVEEAKEHAEDLMSRWFAVTNYEILDISKQDIKDFQIINL